MNLAALGFARVRLPQGEPATILDRLIAKVTRTEAGDNPNCRVADAIPGTKAQPTIPAQVRDYFQRDRKGNEQTNAPADAALKAVKIVGTQTQQSKTPGKAEFLKVIFAGGQASCFDSSLFSMIIRRTGEEAALWFVQSGKYWNIVGIRA